MNIFITGGTSGVGLSLIRYFAQNGHNVCTCSVEDEFIAKSLIPSNVTYYCADVVDHQKMDFIIKDFTGKYKGLDLVIANAGINLPKAKLPNFDKARKVIETNVIGVLNTLSPALNIMAEQGRGHIVGIGSISGLFGLPGMSIYGSSKSAIINMFETFSIDLPKMGIDVTCVVPGFIDTPLTASNQHKMPFIMTIEEATNEILWAIAKKKKLHIFPKLLKVFSIVLTKIPRRWYRFLMGQDFLGFTKK